MLLVGISKGYSGVQPKTVRDAKGVGTDANSVAVIGITANRSPGFDFYDK
jgi:hypothetical protein